MADQRPWSDHEKNTLFAEIIKASSPTPTPGVLFNVIAQQNIQPRWEDTPLPQGRSLNQCRAAFEEMRRQHPHAFLSGQLAPQTPLTAPLYNKRPFSLEPVYPGGREIRPKPYPSASVSSLPSGEPTQKRKRGRPTKAQAQAKAAAAEAGAPPGPSGTAVIAPQGVHMSPQPMVPAATPAPLEELKPTLPPTTRMPISAVLTPAAPKPASSSGSSSGKRRRTRSTRSEPEEYPMDETAAIGGGQEYESPFQRHSASMAPSPARAAVMRHSEEHPRDQQQQPPFRQPHLPPRSEPPPDMRMPSPSPR